MRKRNWFGVCAFAALLIGAGLAALAGVLKHEPNFYRQNQLEPGEGRKALATEFVSRYMQMIALKNARQEKWGCSTSETQLNSFFEELFPSLAEAQSLRSLGIADPVAAFDDDHMRLAFRYGSDWCSTVVSYELKIWLVPKEANTIAVEILSARAGALPISSQSILLQLSELGRRQNKKVSLYRHDGHPVAVIGLQAEQDPHPKWLLTHVAIQKSQLVIMGRTPEHAMQPLDPDHFKSSPVP